MRGFSMPLWFQEWKGRTKSCKLELSCLAIIQKHRVWALWNNSSPGNRCLWFLLIMNFCVQKRLYLQMYKSIRKCSVFSWFLWEKSLIRMYLERKKSNPASLAQETWLHAVCITDLLHWEPGMKSWKCVFRALCKISSTFVGMRKN